MINWSLLRLKQREFYQGFQVHHWVPVAGIISSGLLLIGSIFYLDSVRLNSGNLFLRYHLANEVRRLLGFAVICVILGLLVEQIVFSLLVGTGLCIGYQLYHLHRLHQWLQHWRLRDIPDASGLWGAVFDYLSRHKRLEIREKDRLRAVIERVEATTAALNDGVILLDENNIFNWSNQATERLLGLTSNDIGNSITNYIRHPKFVNYLESGDYDIPLN